MISVIRSALHGGLDVGRADREAVMRWYRETRAALEQEAGWREQTLRQVACTLLLAVIGEAAARFAQIGDGAIVILDGENYRPVFWPQSGEYANTTNFLTDASWETSFTFAAEDARVDELAVMTDGLQALSLDYAAKAAYSPFFSPMFRPLREAPGGASLLKPLREFLDSPRINERTDDDKTLILATRVPSSVRHHQTVR
jgi:hypothetical protein